MDRKSFFTASKLLKDNNLYNDRGIIFWNNTLVNPIPENIKLIVIDLLNKRND